MKYLDPAIKYEMLLLEGEPVSTPKRDPIASVVPAAQQRSERKAERKSGRTNRAYSHYNTKSQNATNPRGLSSSSLLRARPVAKLRLSPPQGDDLTVRA
jgi:hypothetical protein